MSYPLVTRLGSLANAIAATAAATTTATATTAAAATTTAARTIDCSTASRPVSWPISSRTIVSRPVCSRTIMSRSIHSRTIWSRRRTDCRPRWSAPAMPPNGATPAKTAAPFITAPIPARTSPSVPIPAVASAAIKELNLIDCSDRIASRAQAFWRDRGSLRAAANHRSRECEHEGCDQ